MILPIHFFSVLYIVVPSYDTTVMLHFRISVNRHLTLATMSDSYSRFLILGQVVLKISITAVHNNSPVPTIVTKPLGKLLQLNHIHPMELEILIVRLLICCPSFRIYISQKL
jgi:hypothetical protein